MRNGNPDVYRPPGGRTERDVAAEVIVRLLEAGVLPRTPASIARAAAAVGVPVERVRQTWATHGLATVPLDRTRVKTGDDLVPLAKPEPDYAPNYNGNTRAANEKRRAAKEPKPGKRSCNRCGELKPKSEFNLSNRRTGKLRPECKDCNRIYQRKRRLTSEQLQKLGPVLRFILQDGDAHAGQICAACGCPCEVGEQVVASDAVLRHAHHSDELALAQLDIAQSIGMDR